MSLVVFFVWVVWELIKLANHFLVNDVKCVSPPTEAPLEYLTRCYFAATQFNEWEPLLIAQFNCLLLNEAKVFPAKLNPFSIISCVGDLCKSLYRGTRRQFSENICVENDLRSRIFGTFVIKFLIACPS